MQLVRRQEIEDENKGKKILIVGGSGFIGQNLLKKFKDAAYYPCIFDIRHTDSECENCVEADVFDFEVLKDAVSQHDTIIHLVGLADAGIAQKEPAKSFRLNVQSLNNVLEACRIADRAKKLIFPSSAAVYGQPEILPIKENFPANPTNVYSWHKYICEQMIRAYHKSFGLQYVILRLFNVYGKGNKGVIDLFLRMAAQDETIRSFGPYQYRDFVYVGDVAEAAYKAAIYEKTNNRVINIGSGRGTQIKEILDLVCEFYPGTKWINEKTEFEVYDLIADIILAKILLDFKPHSSKQFMKEIIKNEMMKNLQSV
jgi:UDP-glucose 4-epimerase